MKRFCVMAAIIGAVGFGVAVAQAGTTHAVHLSGTFTTSQTSGGNGPPQKGVRWLYAGNLSGPPGGKGTITFHQVFTDNFSGMYVSIGGAATFVEPGGSFSGAISGTEGVHGLQGSVTITNGTGLYKGATGKVAITAPGTSNVSSKSIPFTVTGSITY